MLSEDDLVEGCRNFSREAQKELYARFANKMRAVCLRYVNDVADADDIMQEGFLTVFSEIKKYLGNGSLEGWIRRIMVCSSINFYKKNKKRKEKTSSINLVNEELLSDEDILVDGNEDPSKLEVIRRAQLSEQELIKALDILKDDFRLVFNLFCFENYSHKEISDALGIDEKTSRTRLYRSKRIIQEHLYGISVKKVKQNQTNLDVYGA